MATSVVRAFSVQSTGLPVEVISLQQGSKDIEGARAYSLLVCFAAVALTGTDFLGNAVSMSATTDSDGAYIFANLQPGTYSITETQPAGYNQGIDTVGTAGGSLIATDKFFVSLAQNASGLNGENYNFGEQPQATGYVQKGQTAGIGFWNNKNDQTLIKIFNGGPTSTQLAAWLADTLPHIFGVNAGSNALIHADGSYFTNAEQWCWADRRPPKARRTSTQQTGNESNASPELVQ